MLKEIKNIWAFYIDPASFIKSDVGKSRLTKWAKKVYRKYNNTCYRCNYKAGGDLRLEAHHIYPKSKYPKIALNVSNGVCLCEVCHRTGKDSYHALCGINGNKKMFQKWLKDTKKGNNGWKWWQVVF